MRMPFRSILCPTDLSPIGNSAVRVAYSLAEPDTTVHLLFVCEPAELAALAMGRWAPAYLPTPEQRKTAEDKVHEQLRRLVPNGDGACRTEIHVVHGHPVADRIEEVARAVKADVIVLGTHGRTGLGRVMLGSVATEVMKRRGLSVLLVHDDRTVRTTAKPGAVGAAGRS